MKKKVDKKISVYENNWSFGRIKPNKFDNHIDKSIPLFEDMNWLVIKYADYFIKKNSIVYDLGCSTGRLLNLLAQNNTSKQNIKFYGIDIESNMINYAKNKIKKKNIFLKKADITQIRLKKSDLMISLFTIQFLPQSKRQKLIKKIYENLNWGGGFIFAEKVRSFDARTQDMSNQIYQEWKKKKGFSINEIYHKSKSLKGILDPFSSKGNYDLLKRSGFKDYVTLVKYINFELILAIK
tara:strand:+ start:20 stop:733 length:714 start_codon:yes stop_codon:yes gene_type:complete